MGCANTKGRYIAAVAANCVSGYVMKRSLSQKNRGVEKISRKPTLLLSKRAERRFLTVETGLSLGSRLATTERRHLVQVPAIFPVVSIYVWEATIGQPPNTEGRSLSPAILHQTLGNT